MAAIAFITYMGTKTWDGRPPDPKFHRQLLLYSEARC